MKKVLLTLFGVFLLASCSSDDKEILNTDMDVKDNYVSSNLPKILNLEKTEVDEFKKIMKIDENGVLKSWDVKLLEKAYSNENDYIAVLMNIYNKMGLNSDRIIIVDENNNEKIYNVNNVIGNKVVFNKSNKFQILDDIRTYANYTETNNSDSPCRPSSGSCTISIAK